MLSVIYQLVSTFVATSAIALLLMFVFYYLFVTRPKKKILDKLPATFPHYPIVGSTLHLKEGPDLRLQLQEFCIRDHGPAGICTVWFGMHPVVAIWKAPYVDALLSSHEIKKSYLYNFVKPWLGEGLLTSHGDHWYRHRKLLTPSFHFRILNDFVPVMNEHAESLCEMLEKGMSKGEVDIFPLVTMETLNVICEAAMGQSTDEEDRKARQGVFQAVIDLSHLIQRRQITPYLWPEAVFRFTKCGKETKNNLKIIHDYTDKIFAERLETFDRKSTEMLLTTDEGVAGQKRRPLPFLDSLLYACDNFTKLSEQDIKDEINTFIFTGHDTTAASISWTLWLLARHPEAQKKVHDELDDIFGTSNRPITIEDIRKMPYLSACLKESLRLYPVAPLYARELVNDIKFGDYTVPAGTSIVVLNEILHRDPEYFEEPLEFKPERFLISARGADVDDVPAGKIHPFAYVPFSGGQRNCIGQKYGQQEDKIMLASVMRRFSLECDYTEEDLAPAIEVILRPTKGMLCRLNYR